METFLTAGGKEIQIVTDPRTAHVKVQFKEGGELPEELSGLFTSKAIAEVAVRSYLLNNVTTKTSEKKKLVEKLKEAITKED